MPSVLTDARFLGPVVGAIVLICLVLPSPTSPEQSDLAAAGNQGQRAASRGGELHREVLEGHDVLWERPAGKAKGLLFVAHGCSHQATDFWPASQACKDCMGLPEEVLIREDALRLGYAVVAVSSADRQGSRCWDVMLGPERSADGPSVARILLDLRRREGLEGAPLYVLGASSGGAFVLMLPHLLEVQGVVAQIMAVPRQLLELPSGKPYPPTLFVHMPRDERTAGGVRRALDALHKAQVAAGEIQVAPRPVTPQFLASHSPQISTAMAEAIVKALDSGGLLAGAGAGGQTGLLLKDPRRSSSQWHALLREVVPGIERISLVADESPVSELLNLAWAEHEIISDYTRVSLAWLEAGGKRSLEELMREDAQ